MDSPWATTQDTREAAALATLGIEVTIKATLSAKSGKHVVIFHLSPADVGNEGVVTARLRHQWKSGNLEKEKPLHPMVMMMRSFVEEALWRDFLNGKGRPLVLRARGEKWVYEAGPGLPGIPAGAPVIKTGDLSMMIALGKCGYQVVKIEAGTKVPHVFWLCPVRSGLLSAVDLIEGWRRDWRAMAWNIPFTQVMRGFVNKKLLVEAVKEELKNPEVALQKPGTRRWATVQQEAAPEAWDKVKRFLDET